MAIAIDAGFPVTERDADGWSNSYVWPPFTTPGANRFIVAMRIANGSTVLTANTFTSSNLTWTKRASAINTGATDIVEIWTAPATSVVTDEEITETYSGGNSYSRGSFVIWSLSGVDVGGTPTGDTSVSSTSAADGDPSLTVDAAASTSLLLAGLMYRSSGSDTAPDGNTTSQYNAGAGGSFNFNERAVSRIPSGAGSFALGFTGDDVFGAWQMAGIEILVQAGTTIQPGVGAAVLAGLAAVPAIAMANDARITIGSV